MRDKQTTRVLYSGRRRIASALAEMAAFKALVGCAGPYSITQSTDGEPQEDHPRLARIGFKTSGWTDHEIWQMREVKFNGTSTPIQNDICDISFQENFTSNGATRRFYQELAERFARAGVKKITILVHGFEFDYHDASLGPFATIYRWPGRQACQIGARSCDVTAIRNASWIANLDLLEDREMGVIAVAWPSEGISARFRKDYYRLNRNRYYLIDPELYEFLFDLNLRYPLALRSSVRSAYNVNFLVQNLHNNGYAGRMDLVGHSLGTNVVLYALNLLTFAHLETSVRKVILASGAAPLVYRRILEDCLARRNHSRKPFQIYNVFTPNDHVIKYAANSGNFHINLESANLLIPSPYNNARTPFEYFESIYLRDIGRMLWPIDTARQPIGQENSIPNTELWRDVILDGRSLTTPNINGTGVFGTGEYWNQNHYNVLGARPNVDIVRQLLS